MDLFTWSLRAIFILVENPVSPLKRFMLYKGRKKHLNHTAGKTSLFINRARASETADEMARETNVRGTEHQSPAVLAD